MRLIYIGLFLTASIGCVLGTEVQKLQFQDNSDPRLHLTDMSHAHSNEEKHKLFHNHIEDNKKNIKKLEIEHCINVINDLEIKNNNAPDLIKNHYVNYKKEFVELMKEFEKDPNINVDERIFLINQEHNIFSTY